LEPLADNLPNIPEDHKSSLIRVNDGNDSNVSRELVMKTMGQFSFKFYNTAIPHDLEGFDAPVVLTVNPGRLVDTAFHRLKNPPANLMFVRVLYNAWNYGLCDEAIEWYTQLHQVPVVLTFMAYHSAKSIRPGYEQYYVERKRTMNSYWAITTAAWREIMRDYENNLLVHSCGKVEGELGNTKCRYCGNCHREWFVARERMHKED
jgi:hypothetical protein